MVTQHEKSNQENLSCSVDFPTGTYFSLGIPNFANGSGQIGVFHSLNQLVQNFCCPMTEYRVLCNLKFYINVGFLLLFCCFVFL